MISQDRLKYLINYNPETGTFTWNHSLSSRMREGFETGTISDSGTKKYIKIRVDKKLYFAHRLAFLYMVGHTPDFIDHINGDGTDNRWENLRPVTQSQNSKNARKPSNNTSGIVGVSFHKGCSKWHAYINSREKRVNIGFFEDFFEACCARKSAERRFGFHKNHGSQRPL